MSIGTETCGSLISPAARAGIYTLKPTLGIVPGAGIIPVSKRFDTAGPMAKSVRDVADLLTTLVDPTTTHVPTGGYAAVVEDADWAALRVGTLAPPVWHYDAEETAPVAEVDDEIVRWPRRDRPHTLTCRVGVAHACGVRAHRSSRQGIPAAHQHARCQRGQG